MMAARKSVLGDTPPEGLVAYVGDDVALLSMPSTPSRALDALTHAERSIARKLVEGLSNAAIARARGTSERTVANQVAAIFRKLGVGSRAELARRFPMPTE
jgi:DNA-binding NarL/FixJ family response regulator